MILSLEAQEATLGSLLFPDSAECHASPFRHSKVFQEALDCQREAGDPILSSSTTYGAHVSTQGYLTWLGEAAATWRSQGVVASWL